MKVSLIEYTGSGHREPALYAAKLLVFTKRTRLEMTADTRSDIDKMRPTELIDELTYMANTIPSSWEFVDYTFLINDVTRAFTHQFVRTRTGSYAQQTMRVLNVDGWTYGTGPSLEGENLERYQDTMQILADEYNHLIENDAKIEDARGILPTNIHTNIVAKFNLRILAEMFRKRASSRTQGEYREVIDAMKDEVLKVHPWTKLFFDRSLDVAAAELEGKIKMLDVSSERKTNMIKLIDQMRGMG